MLNTKKFKREINILKTMLKIGRYVINIVEIEDILNQIKGNIKHLHEEIIMQNEIKLIESKTKTLNQIQNRK